MLQGNCSASDPAAALSFSAAEAADLLPLKPFQCMLNMHHSWLVVRNASVWVDNLYLRRQPRGASMLPAFAFLSTAPYDMIAFSEVDLEAVSLYVTNTTFQAAYATTAGVLAQKNKCSIYIDGAPPPAKSESGRNIQRWTIESSHDMSAELVLAVHLHEDICDGTALSALRGRIGFAR